jgi:hypothetical protein
MWVMPVRPPAVTVVPTVHPRPAGTDPALACSKHEEGLAVTEQTAPQYGSAGRTEEASGWAIRLGTRSPAAAM